MRDVLIASFAKKRARLLFVTKIFISNFMDITFFIIVSPVSK